MWSQENVQNQLDGVSRNKTIFERISERNARKGPSKNVAAMSNQDKELDTEVQKSKGIAFIKYWRLLYSVEPSDSNGVTGQGRTSCPFYESLDSVLGTRAASSPPVLLESNSHDSGNVPTCGCI